MKKIIYSLLFLLLSLTIKAQNNTTIHFDKIVHDFGTIQEAKGPVTCTFIFTNTGKKPFKIETVNANCGCTTPAYSTETVKPGETGFIKVTYNPSKYAGDFSKDITVTGNLIAGSVVLTVKGWIQSMQKTNLDEFTQTLGNLKFTTLNIALGDVFSTSVDTVKLKIYNSGNKLMKIQYLETPKHIKNSKLPIYIGPKQMAIIELYYFAYLKKELGWVFDPIKLYTDDAVLPQKDLKVIANIRVNYNKMTEAEKANAASIKFDTTYHDFGVIKQGESGVFEFKFTNNGKSQLVIYSLKASCGCTATTVGKETIEPGESSEIRITYSTKNKLGLDESTVTVFSNDPYNEAIKLTIQANVLVGGN